MSIFFSTEALWMRFWPFTTYNETFDLHNNNPFLFPTHERWIPLFSWKPKANCIFLINHDHFFCASGEYRFPLYNHTHTENCVRTNIITYNRFFLDKSGFKTVIPWKACNSCNRNSSIPCLSEAKFWKKTYEKMIILSLLKTIGGAHPSHPLCSLRHRFKNARDLKFKKNKGLRFIKFMGP